jgi:hypothetical protein
VDKVDRSRTYCSVPVNKMSSSKQCKMREQHVHHRTADRYVQAELIAVFY